VTQETHTLNDLARLAGVTPRTVRFYVSQGLLPPASRPGPGPNYAPAHLGRLRLIRRLQRQHLPLAEIRGRLETLTDDEIGQLLEQPQQPQSSALEYVREQLGRGDWTIGANASMPASGPSTRAQAKAAAPMAIAQMLATGPALARQAQAISPAAAPNPDHPPDRSTWERIELTRDVEIHVRRPLDRHTNRALEKVVEFAREALASE